jgi:hypothetical protein
MQAQILYYNIDFMRKVERKPWTPKRLDDRFLEKRFQVSKLNFSSTDNRIDQQ